tara:strand:- start:353 stop:964 length:612 start_codon:yes stop_codon:yes gene_type:complete
MSRDVWFNENAQGYHDSETGINYNRGGEYGYGWDNNGVSLTQRDVERQVSQGRCDNLYGDYRDQCNSIKRRNDEDARREFWSDFNSEPSYTSSYDTSYTADSGSGEGAILIALTLIGFVWFWLYLHSLQQDTYTPMNKIKTVEPDNIRAPEYFILDSQYITKAGLPDFRYNEVIHIFKSKSNFRLNHKYDYINGITVQSLVGE